MKRKIIALVLILAMVLSFGLMACGNEEPTGRTFKAGTYTAYAPVHNVYIGKADVTVNSKGQVTDVFIDEYFLPHQYASVSGQAAADTLVYFRDYHGAPTATTVAKFIEIDGRQFEAVGVDAAAVAADATKVQTLFPNGTKVGTGEGELSSATAAAALAAMPRIHTQGYPSGVVYLAYKQISGDPIPGTVGKNTNGVGLVTDLVKLLTENEEAIEWFINAIGDGTGFKLLKADKTASGKTAKDYSSGVKKSEGKYWAGTSYYLGWLGNIGLIEEAFKTYYNPTVALSDNGRGTSFLVDLGIPGGQIYIGATATDTPDYWNLCVAAYARAMVASGLTSVDVLPVQYFKY